VNAEHRGKRRWASKPDTYAAAAKRVRKQDRRHRCHARCECVRTTATSTARGCCSGTTFLLLGVLFAILVAIAAITGKL